MKKRLLIIFLLTVVSIFILLACNKGLEEIEVSPSPSQLANETPSPTTAETAEVAYTSSPSPSPSPSPIATPTSEKPVVTVTLKPTEKSEESKMVNSIVYANQMANGVQAFFSKADRSSYTMVNQDMELVHELRGNNSKFISSLKTRDGKEYIRDSMDVFIEDIDGNVFYSGNSIAEGRMNTTRLGLYYYETHIRDLGFAREVFGEAIESVDISNFSPKNWQKNGNIKTLSFPNGKMEIEIESSYDPYVIQKGLNIDTTKYSGIELSLKTDGKASVGEIFFTTSANPNFSADMKGQFTINSDGKYNTYYIDLQGLDKYKGTLTGIRIDVGSDAGEKISIEYVKAVKMDNVAIPIKLDKTFHLYADKVHQEFRALTTSDYSRLKSFAFEVKIEKSKVSKIEIRDKNGKKSDIKSIDKASVEYVAFDIKNVGVVGFIIPLGGTTASCQVLEEGNYYIFRQYAKLAGNSLAKGKDVSFGNRLYTDKTHDFAGLSNASAIERAPLTKLSVKGNNSRAKFVGYDYLVGAYTFSMDSSNFNKAYYDEPDKHYFAEIEIEGDSYNRDIYVCMTTSSGALESGAILDDAKTQVPISLQVCKNFQGEMEEPFYDPQDKAYGDGILPLRIKSKEKLAFTLLNLYQNWGKFPLQQISSIQFHISYYHLSTGVTESNCIAPYFVYGKDGWTLPDFRGASGIMWSSQPQFNSVGRLYFLSYLDGGRKYLSEYTGSYIRSAQNTYVDLDYNYISDCGSYKYSLRHVEFPQVDENRVYYSLDLEFLKDLTIKDVRNNFSLFSFDGRFRKFNKTGYLNDANELVVDTINLTKANTVIYKLGTEYPYFSYFDLIDGSSVMNFAFLLLDSDVTIGGKKFSGNFVYKNYYDGNLNNASLSFDLGDTSFKKGDKIKLRFILLPFGSHLTKDDNSIRSVREDSALKPLTLVAIKGKLVADDFIPSIKAINNEAEFTITGGRNNNTIRVDGFTSLKKPTIYEYVASSWKEYKFYVQDYDGYSVHYNPDGSYSFSFVFNQKSPDDIRRFKISN